MKQSIEYTEEEFKSIIGLFGSFLSLGESMFNKAISMEEARRNRYTTENKIDEAKEEINQKMHEESMKMRSRMNELEIENRRLQRTVEKMEMQVEFGNSSDHLDEY